MHVNVVCRNWSADRVLPRFSRYLADGLGWTLTPAPVPADVHYLMGYFEVQVCPVWPSGPVVSLFTHREEEPPGNAKAALYDQIARRVDLRVAMCRLYEGPLAAIGPTIRPPLPVERDRFVIAPKSRGPLPVVGFAGYTYSNQRKGEDLARGVVSALGARIDWRACGRGWPVPIQKLAWRELPAFYQQLDVLVCTSRVEGGPMTVLEALSCGVPVVVPRGVGLLDELPDVAGVYRYERGDLASLVAALERAVSPDVPIDRDALRTLTAVNTVEAWCNAHAAALAQRFEVAA